MTKLAPNDFRRQERVGFGPERNPPPKVVRLFPKQKPLPGSEEGDSPQVILPALLELERLGLDEHGLARRFVEQHRNRVRRCPALGWLLYNGKRWRRLAKQTGPLLLLAKRTVRSLLAEATNLIDRISEVQPEGEERRKLQGRTRR
jgi:hypothetical protein